MDAVKVVMTPQDYDAQMAELKRMVASSACCVPSSFLTRVVDMVFPPYIIINI